MVEDAGSRRVKRPRGFPLAATLSAVLLAGCLTTPPSVELAKSLRVGGPCRYDTAIGTARIIDLRAAPGSVEMTLTLSMPAAFNPAAWWNREEMRVMTHAGWPPRGCSREARIPSNSR
jgi:hypothetical protein